MRCQTGGPAVAPLRWTKLSEIPRYTKTCGFIETKTDGGNRECLLIGPMPPCTLRSPARLNQALGGIREDAPNLVHLSIRTASTTLGDRDGISGSFAKAKTATTDIQTDIAQQAGRPTPVRNPPDMTGRHPTLPAWPSVHPKNPPPKKTTPPPKQPPPHKPPPGRHPRGQIVGWAYRSTTRPASSPTRPATPTATGPSPTGRRRDLIVGCRNAAVGVSLLPWPWTLTT